MRALLALTVAMGLLIIAGTTFLGILIFRRLAVPATSVSRLSLEEPAGTHIAGMTALGDRLAVRLEGGGPDRILLIDPVRGTVLGHIGLAH